MEPEYLKMEPDSDSDNFKKESPFKDFLRWFHAKQWCMWRLLCIGLT